MSSVVLFDLDGTLVDSREIIYQCMKHALVDVYKKDMTKDQLLSGVGLTLLEQMQQFCPEDPHGAAQVYRTYFYEQGSPLAPAYLGIEAQLRTLQQAGIKMAVVTSKHKDTAVENLKGTQLNTFFDYVLSPSDTTHAKPHPEPLQVGAQRMNASLEDCIYVGDSPFDIQAALQAPMKHIGVTWGFFSEQQLLASGADTICTDIEHLAEMIMELSQIS